MHNHQASVDKLKGTWPALPKDDYCQPNEVGGGSELDDDDEFVEPSDFNDNVADDTAMHMNSTTTNAPSHFISMTKKWNVIWMIAAVAFALLFGTGLGLPLGLVMGTKTYRQQQSETYAATPKSHSSKRDSDRCASKGNKSKGEGGAKSTKAKGKKSTSKSPSSSRGAMKATKVKGSHNKSTKRPSKSKSPTVCAPSPNPTPEPTSTPSPSTSCAYVNAPSSSIATKIKDLIVLQDISDLNALNDETSPQGCAFKWITDGDPINPPLRPGCDDAQIIQRYILAVLYCATNGIGWTNAKGWLSEESECEWYGVDCDSPEVVTSLDLGNNQLDGNIPRELGSLSSLGEFHMASDRVGCLYLHCDTSLPYC
jgi:hypothetical protein